MMRRPAYTLVEVLVVTTIIAIVTAIMVPVFRFAREKGRQSTCISNQRQIAVSVLSFAQDHDDHLPYATDFWNTLSLNQSLLSCPSDLNEAINSYVINNMLASARLGNFRRYQETMVSADGMHVADSTPGNAAGLAYTSSDLAKRHQGKYIVSFLDGHVAMTDIPPTLFELPRQENLVVWLSAERGVTRNALSSVVDKWTDQSVHHYELTALNEKNAPQQVTSVAELGGNPALLFTPPMGQPGILATPDLSDYWDAEEGTIFIVYQPTGNAQQEYTVLDQSNGDTEQGTRVKTNGGGNGGNAAAAGSGRRANGVSYAGGGAVKVSLNASATTITTGDSVTLTWSSTGATAVSNSNFGAATVNGSVTFAPTATTTYSITVRNDAGKDNTDSVTVTVTPPAPTVSLTASPTNILDGDTSTLTWTSANATGVISSNFGAATINGTLKVTPTATTTYTITVTNGVQQRTAQVTVNVSKANVTVNLVATPTAIEPGQRVTLSWTSVNATHVVSSSFGATAVSGTAIITPTVTTTFTITVRHGASQMDTSTATVTVVVKKPVPTIALTASPSSIKEGDNSTLQWSSTNALGVMASNFTANDVNGSTVVTPAATTTYSITVTNGEQEVTSTSTVVVGKANLSVALSASAASVTAGQGVTLTWSSTDAVTVASSNFGAAYLNGSVTVIPIGKTKYEITVARGTKKASASVTVDVTPTADYTGKISWFRPDATVSYPPNNLPYDTPICLTLVSSKTSYIGYHNGIAWPAYSGGPNWLAPKQFYLGGSPHGSNANRRTFRGSVAEVIIYNRALTDKERKSIEQYLIRKYGL